jgi:hypothetical protein
MAGFYVQPELRPCYVKVREYDAKKGNVVHTGEEKKALFHMLSHESHIVPPSMMVGGHSGGVVSGTLAIVEFEDGSIRKCDLEDIRFCDDKFAEFAFN